MKNRKYFNVMLCLLIPLIFLLTSCAGERIYLPNDPVQSKLMPKKDAANYLNSVSDINSFPNMCSYSTEYVTYQQYGKTKSIPYNVLLYEIRPYGSQAYIVFGSNKTWFSMCPLIFSESDINDLKKVVIAVEALGARQKLYQDY